MLPGRNETLDFLTHLLTAERVRRGTRGQTGSPGAFGDAPILANCRCDGLGGRICVITAKLFDLVEAA